MLPNVGTHRLLCFSRNLCLSCQHLMRWLCGTVTVKSQSAGRSDSLLILCSTWIVVRKTLELLFPAKE
ncbi:hypothetical protein KC19_12G133400 [Ceratodon purpureus]|uniref:Uncharacterized protein n=1 Tax=Ceratodon purpureus TaxID=3225 RepID=A0A8T0G7F7_CERPU|nr:hypothetical protein KC19_12G133400 [Ceratodon purpureus]